MDIKNFADTFRIQAQISTEKTSQTFPTTSLAITIACSIVFIGIAIAVIYVKRRVKRL
jgi:hypothetical protein